MLTHILIAALAVCVGAAHGVAASSAPAGAAQERLAPVPDAPDAEAPRDPDLARDPSQPDFAVIALPTTLRVPRGKLAFRLTHRFSRPLDQGDFGSLVEDFFGLDSAAQIGLEFRYGLLAGTQIGVHRTNEKTIQLFLQQDLLPRRTGRQAGLHAIATVEGLDNLRGERTGGVGLVVSRRLADRGAIYAEPIWIRNTNFQPVTPADDDDTVVLGLGARVRIRPTVYVLGELAPRLTGHAPGSRHASFAIEKRAGGHTFQLNVSNSLASTMGQIARGGPAADAWFIGFNVSRKFY